MEENGLDACTNSWAFGPKTVNFVRVYDNSQEPFMASLDILNKRYLISHNLSLQQLSRVVGRLLQMGEKLVPKSSSVCVCQISNYNPNYKVFADVWL